MGFQPHHLHSTLKFLLLPLLYTIFNGNPVNSSKSSCPSFDCGNGVNLSYPFWQQHRRDEYCGYPGFGVTCSNGKPVLTVSNDDYYVKNIDYSRNTLTLVNVEISEKSCPRAIHNITLDTAPLLDYSSDDRRLIFYYNCSLYPSSPQPLSCLLGNNGTKRSFLFLEDEIPMFNWYGNCESIMEVRVLGTAVNRMTFNGFDGVLKDGFRLNWSSRTECGVCEESGGHCGYDRTARDFVCYCSDGHYTRSHCSNKPRESSRSRNLIPLIAYPVAFVIGGMILMASLFYCIYKTKLFASLHSILFWRKRIRNAENVEVFLESYGSFAPQRYKYSDIQKMTNSFKDKLGEGGCGSVFRGKLVDGRLVAVKVLSMSKSNGDQFMNEVATIGRTNHLNIVTLLGFCSEGSKRALIYEFMSNGSLEKYIYAEKPCTTHPLGWEKLYKIALGIARGLDYLHLGCTMRILHFDIKPHNILLDQDFCPKISDFGLAKLCPMRESHVSIACARGTAGYIAPELYYRNFGCVSYKSDVFSYGMMVLEMVGGRKNFDVGVEHTSEIYFPHWIYNRLEQQGDIAMEQFEKIADEEMARKMIMVGLWCTQLDPTKRPSMSRVVEMLEGSIEGLQMPPKLPYFDSPWASSPVGSEVSSRAYGLGS